MFSSRMQVPVAVYWPAGGFFNTVIETRSLKYDARQVHLSRVILWRDPAFWNMTQSANAYQNNPGDGHENPKTGGRQSEIATPSDFIQFGLVLCFPK